jgi:hypothetical protein
LYSVLRTFSHLELKSLRRLPGWGFTDTLITYKREHIFSIGRQVLPCMTGLSVRYHTRNKNKG